jgi:DNA-binding response OmpR family regulator
MRILVIEDNSDIAANLGDYLEDKGHTVDFAADGVTGLHLAVVHDFDAVVLDLSLPGMDGLEVCRKLRNDARKQTPVLMLTARDSLTDKVAGFDSGADDYLVKPFSLVELEVRLKALVRRSCAAHAVHATMRFGELRYDPETQEASRAGVPVTLTRTGYTLLRALLAAAPRIVSRETLEQAVWGDDRPDSDALRTHIHALRQAIDKPFATPMLQTVAGVGYKLVNPDSKPDAAG